MAMESAIADVYEYIGTAATGSSSHRRPAIADVYEHIGTDEKLKEMLTKSAIADVYEYIGTARKNITYFINKILVCCIRIPRDFNRFSYCSHCFSLHV